MTRSFLAIASVVAVVGISSQAQAQPGRSYSSGKLYYNPPSQYLPAPQPQMRYRPAVERIDCTPTFGFYGDVVRQGLLVTQVVHGSEACRIGLEERDVIIKVDNHAIRCQHDWDCAIRDARGQVCLTVRRPCGDIDRLHARIGYPGHSHGHNDHYYQAPRGPQFPGDYNQPRFVPVEPRTGYRMQFGSDDFRIGFSISN